MGGSKIDERRRDRPDPLDIEAPEISLGDRDRSA